MCVENMWIFVVFPTGVVCSILEPEQVVTSCRMPSTQGHAYWVGWLLAADVLGPLGVRLRAACWVADSRNCRGTV